jgi:hypothetical protein
MVQDFANVFECFCRSGGLFADLKDRSQELISEVKVSLTCMCLPLVLKVIIKLKRAHQRDGDARIYTRKHTHTHTHTQTRRSLQDSHSLASPSARCLGTWVSTTTSSSRSDVRDTSRQRSTNLQHHRSYSLRGYKPGLHLPARFFPATRLRMEACTPGTAKTQGQGTVSTLGAQTTAISRQLPAKTPATSHRRRARVISTTSTPCRNTKSSRSATSCSSPAALLQ